MPRTGGEGRQPVAALPIISRVTRGGSLLLGPLATRLPCKQCQGFKLHHEGRGRKKNIPYTLSPPGLTLGGLSFASGSWAWP